MISYLGQAPSKRGFLFSGLCLWSADHRICRPRSVPGPASARPQGSPPTSAGPSLHSTWFSSANAGRLSRSPSCLANVVDRAPLNVNRGAQQLKTLSEQRIIAELAPRACGEEERSVTEVTSGGSDRLRSTVRPNCGPTTPCFLSRRSSPRIRPAAPHVPRPCAIALVEPDDRGRCSCRACRSGSRARPRSRTAFCTTSPPLPDQFVRPAQPRSLAEP